MFSRGETGVWIVAAMMAVILLASLMDRIL